ncbi:MAG: 1-acyl-sn-glycerol-3-phosphate acyltransferase [Bacteroides sp.]
MITEFDEIRPYLDEELPQVYEELLADEMFRQVVAAVMPGVPFEAIAATMRGCKTKFAFQKAFCYPLIKKIMAEHTRGVALDRSALADKDGAYIYISNHRDIILDSGFLSVLLADEGKDTVEIAIGDNLLIYPWIKKLVRVNKSFIVQRALTMRQMLESSARMSRYMHYTIGEKQQSIWIAQREGRAKDSNDRTQESVLKMMAMGGEGDLIDRLLQMHIVPLSISYEYDPCDYLKAQEFQQKRDIEGFKKSQADDLLNMQTGLFGFKGRVQFCTAPCIDGQLRAIDRSLPKQEIFTRVAALIDRGIHANYRLYPCNYVAADLLSSSSEFAAHYTPEEKQAFESYVAQQIARIPLSGKDEPFLREKLLQMYANPLKNHLVAVGNKNFQSCN